MNPRRARAGLALLLLSPAAVAASALEGARLFTTAPERARLERLRAHAAAGDAAAAAAAARGDATASGERAAPADDAPPPSLRLRGFVRRSDGPAAVWVNDASTLDAAGLPRGLRPRPPLGEHAGVDLVLPDGRAVRLAPGQTWDPASGRVTDAYGAGR